MEKLYLVNLLEKFYLNGIIEKVKASIKDNKIQIQFVSPLKNMIGEINGEILLEDCELGIYSTTQLLKLLSITDKTLELTLDKQGEICQKLLISDSNFNLEYILADIFMTPVIPTLKKVDISIEIHIFPEFIDNFLKASKATSSDIFSIEYDNEMIEFTIGGKEGFTNKISFTVYAHKWPVIGGTPIIFPVEEFKEILAANKDAKEGILQISEEGILQIEFITEDKITSKYFLVGKE